MKTLFGYVLAKESNVGIPGLVVAAYDSEKTIADIFPQERGKENQPQLAPGTINQLGKRLGSGLTDGTGKFSFGENLKFEGNEARPDLLLIVFAPEDVQAPERPYPLTPEQRILYISSVPRTDAGNEEAFIIRLLQAQLDRFLIPSSSPQRQGNSDTLQLRNAIERTYVSRDNFRTALAPRLEAQVAAAKKTKEDAQRLFRNFSTVPLQLRDHPLLLQDTTDLKAAHAKVMNDGLKRLRDYEGTMQISLDPQALKSYGLKLDEKGEVTGKLNTASLLELIKQATSATGGIDLIRTREPGDKSMEVAWELYTSERKPTPPSDNGPIQ